MASNERWVPILGYELAKVSDGWVVMKRGSRFVRSGLTDEQVSLTTIATCADYTEAFAIVESLRAALRASTA